MYYSLRALEASVFAAERGVDKTVLVPGKTYYFFTTSISNIRMVNIVVNGKIIFLDDIEQWPMDSKGSKFPQLGFLNCSSISLSGDGVIDGNGYKWWWYVISILFKRKHTSRDNRGDMIYWSQSTDISISNLTFRNSPK